MNISYNEETKEYYTETGEILEDMTEEEYEEYLEEKEEEDTEEEDEELDDPMGYWHGENK